MKIRFKLGNAFQRGWSDWMFFCFLYYATVTGALLALWIPEFSKYATPSVHLSPEVASSLRTVPVAASLEALATVEAAVPTNLKGDALLRAADDLLKGELGLPGHSPVRIGLPFHPADLEQGLPNWQLNFASLVGPRLLLDAYAVSHQEQYFKLALDMIVDFCRFESRQWIDKGFLWNDHAIAARAGVYILFWNVYRQHPSYDPEKAALILAQVSRTQQLLAKPGAFTFATNHGVMQNFALLHLANAFPLLPHHDEFLALAHKRLTDQIRFFVDSEGFVLEHSAGYHAMGISLLSDVIDITRDSGLTAPQEWIEKYQRGKMVLSNLSRPDKSLPTFGDTNGSVMHGDKPDISAPMSEFSLYPVAGYAVAWDHLADWPKTDRLAQTVMAWSNFPGHGHKLADEMSVLIWARGNNWITSSGYWPYGVWGREQAGGWDGSNSPHAEGESAGSARTTALTGYFNTAGLQWMHLCRRNSEGYSADRQLIHIGDSQWIVIDSATDARMRPSVKNWTFPPNVSVTPAGSAGAYTARPVGAAAHQMEVVIRAATGADTKLMKGSKSPFVGWIAEDGKPTETTALRVSQPSDGNWGLSMFRLTKSTETGPPTRVRMHDWLGPANWRLEIDSGTMGVLRLERDGANILMSDPSGGVRRMVLSPGPDIASERNTLAAAFKTGMKRYPREPERRDYRTRISYVWLTLFLTVELALVTFRRKVTRYLTGVRMLGAAAWSLGAYWTVAVYLARG